MSIIVKRKGHKEKFDEKKVYGSVYGACASASATEHKCEKTAEEITEIVKKMVAGRKEVSSNEIREKIKKELGKKGTDFVFYYEQHLPNLKLL